MYSGKPFAAMATVVPAGSTTGLASLEGVTPTLTYFAGSTASGTALPSAPVQVGTYTVVANFAGSSGTFSANSASAV